MSSRFREPCDHRAGRRDDGPSLSTLLPPRRLHCPNGHLGLSRSRDRPGPLPLRTACKEAIGCKCSHDAFITFRPLRHESACSGVPVTHDRAGATPAGTPALLSWSARPEREAACRDHAQTGEEGQRPGPREHKLPRGANELGTATQAYSTLMPNCRRRRTCLPRGRSRRSSPSFCWPS